MSTPLELLRDCLTAGRPVLLEGDSMLVLDGLRVPRATHTNYKAASGGYYTLFAVWFFYEKRDMDYTSYINEARAANIGFVSRVDRVDLLNYLSGEVATSSKIDESFVGDDDWLVLRGLKRPAPAAVAEPEAPPAAPAPAVAPVAAAVAVAPAPAPVPASDGPVAKRSRREHADDRVSKPEPFVSSVKPIALLPHERRLRDRTTVLLSDTKSFAFVNKVVRDAQARAASAAKIEAAKPPPAAPAAAATATASGTKPAGRSPSKAAAAASAARNAAPSGPLPIIIVPATSSLITLVNVKEFLEDSTFVDPVEKRSDSIKREKEVIVRRPNAPPGQPAMFRVIDMPARLKPNEMDEILCIFASGRDWQLKDYAAKWPTPAKIFSNVLGVHVKYEDEKLDPNIHNWNVTVLPINRTKRHFDSMALEKFWEKLDAWMIVHKQSRK